MPVLFIEWWLREGAEYTNRVRVLLRDERRQVLRRQASGGRRAGERGGGRRGREPRAHARGLPGGALVAQAVAVLVDPQQQLGHRALEARLREEPVRRHQRLQLLRVYTRTRTALQKNSRSIRERKREHLLSFRFAIMFRFRAYCELLSRRHRTETIVFALFYGLLM